MTTTTETAPTLYHNFERQSDSFVNIPIYYVTRPEQVAEAVAWAKKHKMLLADIETDGSSPDGLRWESKKIATIQIGTPLGPDPRAYVFCVRSLGDGILPALKLFEDPNILWLGQNIRFEVIWTAFKWGVKWVRVACTQVAEMVLRAGLFPAMAGGGDDGQNRKIYGQTSMKELCMRHLGITIDKGEDVRLTFWSTPAGKLTKRHLVYAAGDVLYPAWVALEQKQELLDRGLRSVTEIEFGIIPILADSEIQGIGLDVEEWTALAEAAEIEQAEAVEKLDQLLLRTSAQTDLFGRTGTVGPKERPTLTVGGRVREINYNAPDQVRRMIYNYCKLKNWPLEIVISNTRLMQLKREYGQEWRSRNEEKLDQIDLEPGETDESKWVQECPDWVIPETQYVILLTTLAPDLWFNRLCGYLPAELIEPFLEYKEATKKVSTYGHKFLGLINPRTGRIHTYWHQVITTTGRLSSEPNLQNIPKDPRYRAAFKPRKGWKFVIYDFSQIEPRLSAEVSNDQLYCKTFNDGADIYTRVGEAQTGMIIDRKTDAGAQLRQGSKTTVLGTAYNMGARKLRKNLILNLEKYILGGQIKPPSMDYAKAQLDSFFRVAPGIKAFQDLCIARADPANKLAPRIWDKYLRTEVTYVTAPCGRKRFFPPDAKNVYTEAPNAPIQGCVLGSTRILTEEHGYVKIEDVVGEAVTVWDGEQFSPARVAASGMKQLVRVALVGGHEIFCSPNHRFLVITNYNEDTQRWIRADELKPCHRVVLAAAPAPSWCAEYAMPVVAAGQAHNANNRSLVETLLRDSTRCGEVFGRLASDGSNSGRQLTWLIAEHEVEILPRLRAALEEFGHVTYRVSQKAGHAPMHRLTVSATKSASEMKLAGIKDRIPDVVWANSAVLAGYLRGMFDGDGTVSVDGAILTFGRGGEKRAWALEIQQALLLFGIQSRVRSYEAGASDNGRTVVQIMKRDMPQFAQLIGFLNPRKQHKAEAVAAIRGRGRMGPAQLVQSVEIMNEWAEMYDVVDSASQRFVANGLITHNCSATITKLATLTLWRECAARGIPIHFVNYMHDELVVETPDAYAAEVSGLLKEHMEAAGRRYITKVPVIADAKGEGIFDYWHKEL